MKTTLKPFLFLIVSLISIHLSAQTPWDGPNSGFVDTEHNVRIIKPDGLFGTPEDPLPPVFEAKLIGDGDPKYLFHIGYSGKVGIGTHTPSASLHIANSGNFRMSRTNGNSICSIDNIGKFILTTDGINSQTRGLFINNGTSDFFKVTQSELSYSSVFKIDNNVILTADLIIKDSNGDIQFRAFKDGTVWAREVNVNMITIPPDYVFDESYKLLTLSEVEQFIAKHKHLPNVASAKEMTDEGSINVNEMQFKLLEKVEELTLYLIQLKNENEALKNRVSELETQMKH